MDHSGSFDHWKSPRARKRVAEVAGCIYFTKLALERGDNLPDPKRDWKLYRSHLEGERGTVSD